MNPIAPHRRRRAAAVFGGLIAVSAVVAATANGTSPASAFDGPDVGIVCTTSPGSNPTFDMETDSDYINLPDGHPAELSSLSGLHVERREPGDVVQTCRRGTVEGRCRRRAVPPVAATDPPTRR